MVKTKTSVLIIITTLLLLASCSFTPTHEELLQLNLKEHKEITMHIHPTIEIEIMGEKQIIPDGIGITKTGMRVIHTHGTDGKLHIESPYPAEFYLKDFFTIWGKTFNEKQLFFYTTDTKHTLKVYVNGKEDTHFGDIPLKDGETIKIVYK